MEKGKWSKIIVTAIIVAVVGGGGIYLWQARSIADCSKLGTEWELFKNDRTSLSFCYKNIWGNPDFTESGIDQKRWVGTFNSILPLRSVIDYKIKTNNFPMIVYSTLDFQLLGDNTTLPVVDWKESNFKSDSELARLFPNDRISYTGKLTVNGQKVLKVYRNYTVPLPNDRSQISYFMPNVVISEKAYNLYVTGFPEQESDIENLLESMHF